MNPFEESELSLVEVRLDIKSALYDSLIINNFHPIAIIDADLRFVTANRPFCQILDLPNNHSVNQFQISALPFSDNIKFSNFLEALIDNKFSKFELEFSFNTLLNNSKTVQLKMGRIEENGQFLGGVLQLSDVTNQREKVTLLEEKIVELSAQNQQMQRYIHNNLQLENFAYIASHDMKEPLRMIGNFSQLLAKRCEAQLNNEGKEYLEYILNGVRNMNGFVNDLLMYSRLDRKEQIIQETNLDILFYLLRKEFEDQLVHRNAEIIINQAPHTIFCCKEKIKNLFQQLISNSLKYSKIGIPIKIEISGRETDNFYEFSVSDNGIGLNEDFAEKIFMLFKKLHPKSKYPGTGIGLAMCKKIVEQHGGKISVKSKLGEGATFTFTLKKEV